MNVNFYKIVQKIEKWQMSILNMLLRINKCNWIRNINKLYQKEMPFLFMNEVSYHNLPYLIAFTIQFTLYFIYSTNTKLF